MNGSRIISTLLLLTLAGASSPSLRAVHLLVERKDPHQGPVLQPQLHERKILTLESRGSRVQKQRYGKTKTRRTELRDLFDHLPLGPPPHRASGDSRFQTRLFDECNRQA